MKPPAAQSTAVEARTLVPIVERLRQLPGLSGLAVDAVEPMPIKGIAHDHVRLAGSGMVLRMPRLSQFGMAPHENLAYQAACFRRAEPSGATPCLHAVIEPDEALPFGALLVEEVRGHPPHLPDDLPEIAAALARVHALPVPEPRQRPPLQNHADPLSAMVELILRQCTYMDRVALAEDARRQIAEEIAWARDFAARHAGEPHPVRLVVTDTQPGNFLVGADGRAVAVDLEKMLYGSPAVDLAHATLYTSTRWDPDVNCVLSVEDVRRFEASWLEAAAHRLAAEVEPWLVPMRRLTWLRSTTFFMRWLVESAGTGDWSGERLGPDLSAHFRRHVLDCLDPGTIEKIRNELHA